MDSCALFKERCQQKSFLAFSADTTVDWGRRWRSCIVRVCMKSTRHSVGEVSWATAPNGKSIKTKKDVSFFFLFRQFSFSWVPTGLWETRHARGWVHGNRPSAPCPCSVSQETLHRQTLRCITEGRRSCDQLRSERKASMECGFVTIPSQNHFS